MPTRTARMGSAMLERTWTVDDTRKYYETMAVSEFHAMEDRAGLIGCPDLRKLREMAADRFPLDRSLKYLEIGIGTGRVVSWLLENLPRPKVVGIDSCRAHVDQAMAKFGRRAEFHHRDVLELRDSGRFDVALWLFSGSAEISPDRRAEAFQRIREALRPSGALLLDMVVTVPRDQVRESKVDSGYCEVENASGTRLPLHVPTSAQIEEYAKAAGLSLRTSCSDFQPKGDRRRFLAVFEPEPGR